MCGSTHWDNSGLRLGRIALEICFLFQLSSAELDPLAFLFPLANENCNPG